MVRPAAFAALSVFSLALSAPAAGAEPVPGSLPEALPASEGGSRPDLDPNRGTGTRSVSPGKSTLPPAGVEAVKSSAASPKKNEPPPKTHRVGRPPKTPAASLPEGVPRPDPDPEKRRQVAGGATGDDLEAGAQDPELRSLREAERALFPRPVPGLSPGWSWGLPRPAAPGGPEVVTGSPPGLSSTAAPEPALDAAWLRSLSMPDIPVRLEERVLQYLSFYKDSEKGQAIAHVWARKSGRYQGALKREVDRLGLPSDLIWVSLIESGHNPTIVSPAGAVGLWQFMPEAGRAYGLVIDRWVDERLDPERSTQAACRYLSDLHRRFGNWDLALAAYNMGYGGLSRAIRKYNSNDFWELSRYEAGIPWETTLYVPKILATAILMSNREAFGVSEVAPEEAEAFDTVLVGPGVALDEIASLAGVPAATVRAQNPQFLVGRTPPGVPGAGRTSWEVRLPRGKGPRTREALAKQVTSDALMARYVVTSKDTVASIAKARGITEAELRKLNHLAPTEAPSSGTVLLLPRIPAPSAPSPEDRVVVVPPRSLAEPGQRVFYRVQANDSLSGIAERFDVTVNDLARWNALDLSARLQSGMSLQLFVPEQREIDAVPHLTSQNAEVLVAGSEAFFEYFERQNGKNRLVILAREGDTLSKIGARYQMSVGSMERVNRRSRKDAVEPGRPIVVYTERSSPMPGDRIAPEPPTRLVSSDAREASASDTAQASQKRSDPR